MLGGEPSNLKARSIDKLENLVTFGYSFKSILKTYYIQDNVEFLD